MSKPFHTKYRPSDFSRIVGHEKQITRLKGIIKTGNYPNALLFTGPPSAGKTTLARCFAAEANQTKDIDRHPDYLEQNAGASGKIEDVRQLIEVSRLQPQRGVRRFIVIDEAQNLTGAAAQALLKPLEEPPPKTVFILCSMEPEKLGKAIAQRCGAPFILESHSKDNIIRHLKRIIKAEEMDYAANDKIVAKIADNSNGVMRNAANLLEALQQYASGMNDKISVEDVDTVIASTASKDDEIAVQIILGVYAKKYSVVQKALLDAQDSFSIINKLIWLNGFMLNTYVLKGEKHPKVWWSKWNIELRKRTDGLIENRLLDSKAQLNIYATTQIYLVRLRQQAASFLVPEQNLIGGILYELIRELKR